MRDADVRLATKALIADLHPNQEQTLVVHELGLNHGEVLVDIAVINGELCGYELKSERDTLDRLPNQVRVYSEVLDRAYLVVAGSHLEEAKKHLPEWWGIWVASRTEWGVAVAPARHGVPNPSLSPLAIAQLLWKEEALDVLEGFGGTRGLKSKPRQAIYDALASRAPLPELRRCVRERLRGRTGWPASASSRDAAGAPPR